MPGNKVNKKQLEPFPLKPLRPENKYMYKESLQDVKDFNSLTYSQQEPALALYIAEMRQAAKDERRKVFKLKEAFLRGDSLEKVEADGALAKRRNEAEKAVIVREAELQQTKEDVAKATASRKAELDEVKMLLSAEKRIGAMEIKSAKEKLKKAKADAKRTKPSFIARLRNTFVEKPKEMLREEGRKKRGAKK